MSWFYIDVETSPPMNTFPNWSAVKPPKHYKDPEKIRAYQEENAHEAWAKKALSPTEAQVIIVGVARDDGDVVQFVNTSEALLMAQLDAWWQENRTTEERGDPDVWCGYNGVGFDFLLLSARALRCKLFDLGRSLRPVNDRYGDAQHKDPFVALGRQGKLDEWAEFFRLERTPIKGHEVYELVRAGRSAEALAKNKNDVEVLRSLASILREGRWM